MKHIYIFVVLIFMSFLQDDPLVDRLKKLHEFLLKNHAPNAAVEKAKEAIKEKDVSFADEALGLAYKEYYEALKLLESGDPKAPIFLGKLAGSSNNEYVRLHSLYHLGRLLLDSDDPEGAVKTFNDFFSKGSNLTPYEAEASFFLGIALSKIPSREEAISVLTNFLKAFPWAPERYKVVAWQVLEELKTSEQNPLFEVADQMKSVERKLKKGDPGEKTVKQEKEIIKKLDELIEKMEQNERKNSGGSGTPNNNQQPPTNPLNRAKLSKGKVRLGALRKSAYTLAQRWAKLNKKEREKILQALKSKFPPRYREILEAYFKRLSKNK